MRAGIMQPYFFPYIGYWQLIAVTDRFVIYDDVNYIKGGWINRNRILINGEPHYINLPIHGASSNKRICDVEVRLTARELRKMRQKLTLAYHRAPFFDDIYGPVTDMIERASVFESLSGFLTPVIKDMAASLGMYPEFYLASELWGGRAADDGRAETVRGEDRVIATCGMLGADIYYNPAGGRGLYQREHFSEHGIELRFLDAEEVRYPQFGGAFCPRLSIIDVLMFNGWERTAEMCRIHRTAEC